MGLRRGVSGYIYHTVPAALYCWLRRPGDFRQAVDPLTNDVTEYQAVFMAWTHAATVFGVGPLDPEVMFLGEAPGADEDRAGEPFVGAAGQLFNGLIQEIGLRREDVYIANMLKCRPPAITVTSL